MTDQNDDIASAISEAVYRNGIAAEDAGAFAGNLIEWLAANGYVISKRTDTAHRIYRVLGTDRDGFPVEVEKPSEHAARHAVDTANRTAAERGQPQDWRAEYTDIEWKPLTDD